MDDVEAEAALLALGETLLWKQNYSFGEVANMVAGQYFVNGRKKWWLRSRYKVAFCAFSSDDPTKPMLFPDVSLQQFKTVAAAKAACERHQTTGKWQ